MHKEVMFKAAMIQDSRMVTEYLTIAIIVINGEDQDS